MQPTTVAPTTPQQPIDPQDQVVIATTQLPSDQQQTQQDPQNSQDPQSLQTQQQAQSSQFDTLNEILDEVEGVKTDQQTQPVGGGRGSKEKSGGLSQPDFLDGSSGGMQAVEEEKNPEIPIEVESFLQRVEDHSSQAPQEIVIADGVVPDAQPKYPTKPVVVLPITQEEEAEGIKKSVKTGFRWLVEWSRKITQMFIGEVIYKQSKKTE